MNLVVGASGTVGGMIVARLRASGEQVRALVRNADAGARARELGAEVVEGDLKDADSLRRACAGATRVITTASSVKRMPPDSLDSVDRAGNRNLIDAARDAGVEQFLFVSVSDASPSSPMPLFAAKGETEVYLRASGVPYTILAPHAFMEDWIGLVVATPLQQGLPLTLIGGRRKHSFISNVDVAAFATAVLGRPAAINRRLLLGGPSAWSWTELVERLERRLGRTLTVRFAAPGGPLPGLPMPLGQVIGIMLAGLESADVVIEMNPLYEELGITPKTVDAVLDDLAPLFLAPSVPAA